MLDIEQELTFSSGREAVSSTDTSLLKILVILAQHRRLLLGGMLIAAAIIALVVLVMPPTYTASTVILTSQNPPGAALALLGELGSLGALGGDCLLKTQADTFVGVLGSRTVADTLIQNFHLQSAYRSRTLGDTRKALARHTYVEAAKGSLIRISVDDHDVQRRNSESPG